MRLNSMLEIVDEPRDFYAADRSIVEHSVIAFL